MHRGIPLLVLLFVPAHAGVLVQHDYDPVSDAVVSWTLNPGERVGQTFRLAATPARIGGFRVKLQKWGEPADLEIRLGTRPGMSDIGSGQISAKTVSPWFEHWCGVQLARPASVHTAGPLYLEIRLAAGGEGHYEVFGTASDRIDRPEFQVRSPVRPAMFENPVNLDYGARTPRYDGGAAYDSRGAELPQLDLAFQIFDTGPETPAGEERFAFIDAIAGPLYPSILRDPGAQRQSAEIELDSAWRIQTGETPSAVVDTAAREFSEFLERAMGVKIGGNGQRVIVAKTGCGSPPRKPEGFDLRIDTRRIEVCGFDDRGVMQGLHFLEAKMRLRRGPFLAPGRETRAPVQSPRITSAPFYSRMEWEVPRDQYTPGMLGRISRSGFNAIWVWGDMDEVAHSEIYPELDHGVARRQAALNVLVARAARYGIDVYMYLANRPLPESFFAKHPDVRGSVTQKYGGVNVLCSSVPEVRRHFVSATRNLMTAAPGLKGVVVILGGEGFWHCYSRKNTCERCLRRVPQDTVAEIAASLLEGVRGKPLADARASPPALAIWLYSASSTWSRDDITQSRLIEKLPRGVTLLTEFGKEAAVHFGGITIPAYDYPISIVGPADRFVKQSELARARGLELWIKTEHAIALEFVETPYIPVFFQWAERFRRVRESPGATGVFANWMHYGFTPSMAADVFYWNIWDKPTDAAALLEQLARRDFGAGAEETAVHAWRSFSDAIQEYPFSGSMAMGVIQQGPAHPLFFYASYRPLYSTGRQFKNDLSWTTPWGADLTIAQFTKMRERWASGVTDLERVVVAAPPELRMNAQRELGIARALLACVTSTINIAKFYGLREKLNAAKDRVEASRILTDMTAVAEDELRNARGILPVVSADSRLGYANSANNEQTGVPRGGIYSPGSIQKKIAQVERLLREDIPNYRRQHGID